MKDFPFWRGAMYNAKTPLILKSVGEELAKFQNLEGLFGDAEKKLTVVQLATLRKQYSEKMNGFDSLRSLTAGKLEPPGKPKFKK